MDRIENDTFSNSSVVACVFVAAVTFLSNRCLVTYTYKHTGSMEGFMKYAVQMGSGAMIYIPSFIKTGLGIQRLIGGRHRHTDSMMTS
jgi:hypothetical protein